MLHRRRKRVLQRLLGQVEVAEEADEGGVHAPGFRSENGVYWI
jgi:hypothetical protein